MIPPAPESSLWTFQNSGTDRLFRNVDRYNSQAGESPKRKNTASTTRRKFEIDQISCCPPLCCTVNGFSTGSVVGETFKLQSRDLKKNIASNQLASRRLEDVHSEGISTRLCLTLTTNKIFIGKQTLVSVNTDPRTPQSICIHNHSYTGLRFCYKP